MTHLLPVRVDVPAELGGWSGAAFRYDPGNGSHVASLAGDPLVSGGSRTVLGEGLFQANGRVVEDLVARTAEDRRWQQVALLVGVPLACIRRKRAHLYGAGIELEAGVPHGEGMGHRRVTDITGQSFSGQLAAFRCGGITGFAFSRSCWAVASSAEGSHPAPGVPMGFGRHGVEHG